MLLLTTDCFDDTEAHTRYLLSLSHEAAFFFFFIFEVGLSLSSEALNFVPPRGGGGGLVVVPRLLIELCESRGHIRAEFRC